MQERDISLKMTVDYHKLTQMATPIIPTASDLVALLEKVNTSPSIWYVVTDLVNVLFFISLVKATRSSCFQLARQ